MPTPPGSGDFVRSFENRGADRTAVVNEERWHPDLDPGVGPLADFLLGDVVAGHARSRAGDPGAG